MNNDVQKLLSKEESYKLMQELMSKGCLRTVELRQNGVRRCTIMECWDELAYEKYQARISREGPLPAIIIRQQKRAAHDLAIAQIEASIDNRNSA